MDRKLNHNFYLCCYCCFVLFYCNFIDALHSVSIIDIIFPRTHTFHFYMCSYLSRTCARSRCLCIIALCRFEWFSEFDEWWIDSRVLFFALLLLLLEIQLFWYARTLIFKQKPCVVYVLVKCVYSRVDHKWFLFVHFGGDPPNFLARMISHRNENVQTRMQIEKS